MRLMNLNATAFIVEIPTDAVCHRHVSMCTLKDEFGQCHRTVRNRIPAIFIGKIRSNYAGLGRCSRKAKGTRLVSYKRMGV